MLVACVLRSGGHYDVEYVERLRDGVAKHLPIDHRFVCISDVNVPCERIVLRSTWPGWWAKIELFWRSQPVLYFDLDTIICGDLSDIAAQAEKPEFTILRDFYRKDGLGSGMMAWGIDMKSLYDRFFERPSEFIDKYRGRGDQGFIEDHVDRKITATWQDRLPGQVVSYKVHVRDAGKVPEGARVICFHGNPRPREIGWNV